SLFLVFREWKFLISIFFHSCSSFAKKYRFVVDKRNTGITLFMDTSPPFAFLHGGGLFVKVIAIVISQRYDRCAFPIQKTPFAVPFYQGKTVYNLCRVIKNGLDSPGVVRPSNAIKSGMSYCSYSLAENDFLFIQKRDYFVSIPVYTAPFFI